MMTLCFFCGTIKMVIYIYFKKTVVFFAEYVGIFCANGYIKVA